MSELDLDEIEARRVDLANPNNVWQLMNEDIPSLAAEVKRLRSVESYLTRNLLFEADRADAAEARLAAVRKLHRPISSGKHDVTMNDGTPATYVYGCRCGALSCPTQAALNAEVTDGEG